MKLKTLTLNGITYDSFAVSDADKQEIAEQAADMVEIPSKTSDLTNDSGFITGYTETDPTVPAWAKNPTKPSYTKSEVGLGNVDNVKQYSASNPPPYPVTSVNGKTGAVTLDASAVGARPASWMPSASDVGALPASTTIPTKVSQLTNDKGYLTQHQDISGKLDSSELPTAINTALAQAKASGEFDGKNGTSATHSWNGTVLTVTSASGTSSADLKGAKGDSIKGDPGQRGTGLLSVTTAPSSYTTAVGGITPKYRMAISTIKSQAGVTEVLLGDTIRYSYYQYPIEYLDASYAYCTTRVSLRGTAGTTPVKGTDYFTDADKAEMVDDVKNSIPGLGDLLGAGTEEVTYVPSLNGYLMVETGTIYTDTAGTYHTDYIALDGYAKILASCNISAQGYALAFFNSSKTLLPEISIVAEGSGVTKTINMEVPSEAAYCMLCDYEYAPPSNAFITLIPSRGIVDRVNELDARTTPLNGKTIAVLGDSISSVAYTVPNYWQLIAEKTGCKFLDYGVSGSCFAVRSADHTPSFVERAANMSTSADAVLVMGGTNDANKDILLGDWASTDNTTLYGALNALIATLRSKYPGRPIIFCTPIKMKGDKDDGFPKTMADLKTATATTNIELWHCALAIKAKCAVHGIPVIDLYNESGIGSGLSAYFREDDTLHPSDLGECRIANMVQPILEQQFLYVMEYAVEPVNLVPTSIDTDGSIFNAVGYKDGYRLSSSGGISAQAKSTVTGFIQFSTSDVLRIKGVTMKDSDAAGTYVNNSYINFYDASFAHIGSTSNGGNKGICSGTIDTYKTSEANGVHTYNFSAVDGTNVKYIRISSPFGEAGSGSGMFVTVNQEIT